MSPIAEFDIDLDATDWTTTLEPWAEKLGIKGGEVILVEATVPGFGKAPVRLWFYVTRGKASIFPAEWMSKLASKDLTKFRTWRCKVVGIVPAYHPESG
jgi:hypothetical protein